MKNIPENNHKFNSLALTLVHYKQVGGLTEALSKHANEALEDLKALDKSSPTIPTRERVAEILFRCLCERSSKKRDTRRPVSLSEVAAVARIGNQAITAGVDNDKMRPLIDVIEAFHRPDRSFLILRPESDLPNVDTMLDISHESLIQKWDRLNEWVEDEMKWAEQYKSLEKAAYRWQEHGKANKWLWRSPELDLALQWRENKKPNKQWAQRYGDNFESAMEFLNKSKDQQQAEKEEDRRWIEELAIERSRHLALESTSGEDTHGKSQLGLLLALESLNALDLAEKQLETKLSVPAAEEALRQVMMASGGYCLCGYQDQHWGQINALAVSPNGRWLITGGKNGVVCRWDLSIADGVYSPSVLCSNESESGHKGWVNALAISPDSKWLVTGGDDTLVLLWNLEEAVPVPKTLSRDFGHIHTIIFGPCQNFGYWLIVGSASPTVRLWKFNPEGSFQDKIHSLATQEWGVEVLAISKTGRWLISGHDEGGILWDLNDLSENPTATLEPNKVLKYYPKAMVRAVAISPEEDWLAVGDNDCHVCLWKLSPQGLLEDQPITLDKHKQPISVMAITDNHRLITGDLTKSGGKGIAYLWDLSKITTSQEPTFEFFSHADWISTLAISLDSRWLVTAGGDNIARQWDLNHLDVPPLVLYGHESTIRVAAISYDNRWVFTGSDDCTVRKWDLLSRSATYPIILSGHKQKNGDIWAVAISPNNNWLVTGSEDGTARLWKLTEKGIFSDPFVLNPQSWGITAVTFSCKGKMENNQWLVTNKEKWLITSHDDGTVYLWDLEYLAIQDAATDPKPAIIWQGHERGDKENPNTGKIWTMALSLDNRWLVTGSQDNTACLWDLSAIDLNSESKPVECNEPLVLDGHQSAVWAVAISPRNKWLVTGNQDGTGRLWRLTEITEKRKAIPFVLKPQAWGIQVAAFSYKGKMEDNRWSITEEEKWLITGHFDGTVRLWDLESLVNQDAGTDPQPTFILHGHDIGDKREPTRGKVWTMVLSPDNRWLATGSQDKTACLWDLSSLYPIVEPKNYPIDTPYAVLRGHKSIVRAVIISENRWLYTGSEDGEIYRWDIEAIKPHFDPEWIVIGQQQSTVVTMAISSNNYWLVSGGVDGVARLWNLQLNELKEMACSMVGRNLTQNEWNMYFYMRAYHKTCTRYRFPHTVLREKLKEAESSLEKGNIKLVLDIYQKTEEFETKNAIIESVLKQAESFARVNDKNNAAAFYKQAVAWGEESDAAVINSAICRSGSIYGFTEIVLAAGERAVKLNPEEPAFHDSYGLALALAGRYEESAEELAFYEDWLNKDAAKGHVISYFKEHFEKRHRWIQDLREKRENPFKDNLLQDLKNQPNHKISIQRWVSSCLLL